MWQLGGTTLKNNYRVSALGWLRTTILEGLLLSLIPSCLIISPLWLPWDEQFCYTMSSAVMLHFTSDVKKQWTLLCGLTPLKLCAKVSPFFKKKKYFSQVLLQQWISKLTLDKNMMLDLDHLKRRKGKFVLKFPIFTPCSHFCRVLKWGGFSY